MADMKDVLRRSSALVIDFAGFPYTVRFSWLSDSGSVVHTRDLNANDWGPALDPVMVRDSASYHVTQLARSVLDRRSPI